MTAGGDARAAILLDAPGCLDAVLVGHAQVHQHQPEAVAAIGAVHRDQGLGGRGDGLRTEGEGAEQAEQDLPGHRVVVHHQHAQAVEHAGQGLGGRPGPVRSAW